IKARGTESLMRNEVRSQRLLQLLQHSANPAIAPFIKMGELVRELCYTMDLDAERLVNDEREALRQAQILQHTMGGQGQQEASRKIRWAWLTEAWESAASPLRERISSAVTSIPWQP